MLDPGFLRALAADAFLLHLLFALVLGVVGLVGLYRSLIRARIIEDTPTSRIRSAAQGYVEIVGECEAGAGGTLVGPLTGKPCLWHRYRIERYQSSKNGGRWRTVKSGTSSERFALRDDTGRCEVDPAGADVTPLAKEVWRGSCEWPTPGQRRDGLARFTGSYRYTEERLRPGDPIYVLGDFRTLRGDPAAEASRRIRERLAGLKRDPRRLTGSYDANGDGMVDVEEWQLARQDAQQVVERELAEEGVPPPLNLIADTGGSRRPFLISCHSQRVLARRYRLRSALAAIAATAGCSLTLWMLYARFLAG